MPEVMSNIYIATDKFTSSYSQWSEIAFRRFETSGKSSKMNGAQLHFCIHMMYLIFLVPVSIAADMLRFKPKVFAALVMKV